MAELAIVGFTIAICKTIVSLSIEIYVDHNKFKEELDKLKQNVLETNTILDTIDSTTASDASIYNAVKQLQVNLEECSIFLSTLRNPSIKARLSRKFIPPTDTLTNLDTKIYRCRLFLFQLIFLVKNKPKLETYLTDSESRDMWRESFKDNLVVDFEIFKNKLQKKNW